MSDGSSSNHAHSVTVLKAGFLAVLVNLLLAGFKMTVGLLSNSVAITSDALHGLIDTISGFVVIISEKIGSVKRIKLSHEKIERIGAVFIAMIILMVGIHIIVESVEGLINPEPIEYSFSAIVVMIISIISKALLGRYLRITGERVASSTLIASSVETINDSLISGAVLFSILVHLIWQINIEPYVSLMISILIIKHGIELIIPNHSLGHRH